MKLTGLAYLSEKYIVSQPRVRERITRLIYGNKDETVSIFHKKVRINALRENGYHRAARLSRLSSLLRDEVIILSRLTHFFRPGMTFVDIGANIGIFSIMMADFQNLLADFKVVAFEVNPDTYYRLAVNAEAHGFEAHNVGISSESRTITFVEGAVSHVTRTIENQNRYSIDERKFEAQCRPLSTFDLAGDLVMKLDVEGHEFAVLEGSRSYFDAGRVRCVYIDGYDKDTRILPFFESYGFRMVDCGTLRPARPNAHMLLAIAPD